MNTRHLLRSFQWAMHEHSWERSKARAMKRQQAFTEEMKVQLGYKHMNNSCMLAVNVVIYFQTVCFCSRLYTEAFEAKQKCCAAIVNTPYSRTGHAFSRA